MATLENLTVPRASKAPVAPTERTRRRLAKAWPTANGDIAIFPDSDGAVYVTNSYALARYAADTAPAQALAELLTLHPGHGWFALRSTRPAEPSRHTEATVPNLPALMARYANEDGYREATAIQLCAVNMEPRVRARVDGGEWAYFDPRMIQAAVSSTPDEFTVLIVTPQRPAIILNPSGTPVGLAMPIRTPDQATVTTPDGTHFLDDDGTATTPVDTGE